MIILFSYLLKMIICSGILFLYYRLALRNKVFNQYNRFYLLGSVVLSLLLPLCQFSVASASESTSEIVSLLTTLNGNNIKELEPVVISQNSIGLSDLLFYGVALVGVVLLAKFLLGLLQLRTIVKQSEIIVVEAATVILTKDQRAPFSFFKYIFWRKDTAIESEDGQRIFLHELAHVNENHSYDKILMSLILCICWFNPFFWLIKYELYLIHEFIADRKAVKGENEMNALAAMLLATYHPGSGLSITNNFFHSPIKRRLAMMTKNQKQKLSYASRLFALPLLAMLGTTIALKAREIEPGNPIAIEDSRNTSAAGSKFIQEPNKNVDALPQLPTLLTPDAKTITQVADPKLSIDSPPKPIQIYRVNGTIVGKRIVAAIDPQEIKSISIITDATKLKSMGISSDNSLVEITLKDSKDEFELKLLGEVVVTGYNRPEEQSVKIVRIEDDITSTEKSNDNIVFTQVEHEAQFPGGPEQWRMFLMKNLIFEHTKADKLTKGPYTVIVKFIVNKDGTLSAFTAETFAGTRMAAEAIRVMQAGPKWKPAVQNGKAVSAYRKQPITFVIP